MGYILHCFKCFHRETLNKPLSLADSEKCSECGSKMNVAGPLWLAKIVDRKFCELMGEELRQRDFRFKVRIGKILALIKGEIEAPATYYVVDKLCDALNIPVPSVKRLVDALKKENFQAFLTHFNQKGIKSNVPAMKIRQILRGITSVN